MTAPKALYGQGSREGGVIPRWFGYRKGVIPGAKCAKDLSGKTMGPFRVIQPWGTQGTRTDGRSAINWLFVVFCLGCGTVTKRLATRLRHGEPSNSLVRGMGRRVECHSCGRGRPPRRPSDRVPVPKGLALEELVAETAPTWVRPIGAPPGWAKRAQEEDPPSRAGNLARYEITKRLLSRVGHSLTGWPATADDGQNCLDVREAFEKWENELQELCCEGRKP